MSNETSKEEKKKRIILIGRSTAGKTTLCQRINNEELHYYKTQTVQVINKNMIDTPGEYLERQRIPWCTDCDFRRCGYYPDGTGCDRGRDDVSSAVLQYVCR